MMGRYLSTFKSGAKLDKEKIRLVEALVCLYSGSFSAKNLPLVLSATHSPRHSTKVQMI